MISLIVVALVGIGFTRLTMLALELRDNYEDGADEPVDMSRKRVDAHNKMVRMSKPEEMVVKGENQYEPGGSTGKDEDYSTAILASTEATIQAGIDAIFGTSDEASAEAYFPTQQQQQQQDSPSKPSKKEISDPESPSVAVDPTEVCTICFEKAKNAVLLDCGHGGLCYNCSIDVFVTSGHCPFCRNEIRQIVTVGFATVSTNAEGSRVVPVLGPQ